MYFMRPHILAWKTWKLRITEEKLNIKTFWRCGLKSLTYMPFFVQQEHFKPDWWQDGVHLPGWRFHTTSQLPKWVTSSNHYNSDSKNNNRSFCDSFKPHVSFVFLFWEQLKMEVQIYCKHLMQIYKEIGFYLQIWFISGHKQAGFQLHIASPQWRYGPQSSQHSPWFQRVKAEWISEGGECHLWE